MSSPRTDLEGMASYIEGVVAALAPSPDRPRARPVLAARLAARRPWTDVDEASRAALSELVASGIEVAIVSNSRG